MDPWNEPGATRRWQFSRSLLLGLLACLTTSVPRDALSEPRFGDSTWVAPGAAGLIRGDLTNDGPRVAPPDHERGWETALRTPFRIVFFPLRLVASGLELAAGHVNDDSARRMAEGLPSPPAKPGIHVSPTGDISALTEFGVGPSVTWGGFPVADGKLVVSGTWSTIGQRRAHLRQTLGDHRPVGFLLRADYDNTPNRHYYGIGNDTPKTNRSFFLLENTSVEASLLIGSLPLRQVRVVGGYSAMSPRRGSHGVPLLETVYDPASVPFYHDATQEILYGVTGDFASLDDGKTPSRGVHGRFELRHAAGLSSQDPDYNQWLVEGRGYLPVFAKRRVIALRCLYAGVDPTGGTTTLPYYRLSQTAAPYRFAGYPTGRFRDRQLMLAHAEYRWELWKNLEALALYELGEVAPRAADFTVGGAHSSFGGGLRYCVKEGSALRVDVGKSTEGIQVVMQLGSDY